MKMIMIALLSFLYNTLQAQSDLQDSLVARYNRNDFYGFYALGSASWKLKTQSERITEWLGYIKRQTGRVKHSVLNIDSGKTKYFMWDGSKKMLTFKLTLSESGNERVDQGDMAYHKLIFSAIQGIFALETEQYYFSGGGRFLLLL